jgi:hypothetical protein
MMNVQYIVSSHEPIGRFVNVIFSRNKDCQAELKKTVHTPEKEKALKNVIYTNHFFKPLDDDELANIINIIKLLASKIYGTDYENIGPSGNTPNSTIQKILVETGMTELLIEILFILYEPFKDIERNS